MKDKLQDQLASILAAIQNGVGKATDFTMEQLPDIAQQYVLYGRAFYTASLILGVLAIIGCSFFGRHFWRLSRKDEGYIGGTVAAGFAAIPAVIGSIALLQPVFLVWLAPKVWLLSELAKLFK